MPKNNKLSKTEKYWNEVDLLAQAKIYQLLTKNIPFQNTKLITEPWKHEEKQPKLSGLFLHQDADYLTLLSEVENQSSLATSDKEYLVEEITVWYCRMVVKALIQEISGYASFDPSYFENLTNEN